MRIALLCALATLLSGTSMAQVGQTDWSLVDADRDDRPVPCVVWHPDPVEGPYPAVVLAHGFVMGPNDYEGLANALASLGYVVIALGTEMGFAADHAAYGLDLAFVAQTVADNATGGALDGAFNGRIALSGHSMGGGACWLAAAANPPVDAFLVFAPAETSPSAIAAGTSITAPAMVISGTGDAITPPATQHQPLHDAAVNSACRAFVSLIDGGHCGFADPGSLCDIGELGFQGLSPAAQLDATIDVSVAWLNAFLQDDPTALSDLQTLADSSADIECELNCTLSVTEPGTVHSTLTVDRDASRLTIGHSHPHALEVTLWSTTGQWIAQQSIPPGEMWRPVLTSGLYLATSGQTAPLRFTSP